MSAREHLERARLALERQRARVSRGPRIAIAVFSAALCLATFGPMLALSLGFELPSWEGFVHGTSTPFCHQLPERSFELRGHVFPLCTRCSGMWIGITLGIAAGLLLPLRRRWWIGMSAFGIGMALSAADHLREEAGGPGWSWVRFWLGLVLFAGLTTAVSYDVLAVLSGAVRWLRGGSEGGGRARS
ncbi:MAG TPA: DUF2085 domain-containing protein [Polyangiaceae bacterium]|nr:DUF2085 domain-containing protein [Polyangiaceae bacterium]